ncbi:hypothetical protein MRX96_054194 [Rhipicephalus microplus]
MEYVEVLCSQLSRVPQHELRCLDNDGFTDLPKLADKSVPEAVSAVRAHLESIAALRDRLDSAAPLIHLYGRPGRHRVLVLYRADRREDPTDIIGDILKKMRQRRVHGVFAKATENVCCTCLLVPEEERGRDFRPYLFADWYTKPCVAIHETPDIHSPLLETVLRQTLGNPPRSYRCSVYRDLRSLYVGVLQLFPSCSCPLSPMPSMGNAVNCPSFSATDFIPQIIFAGYSLSMYGVVALPREFKPVIRVANVTNRSAFTKSN